ncbi:Protein MEI2-like 2 [Durusdinium trenchii]
MLFFGVGLYGNLQFNYYDPQWAKVDAGGYFNASYIVESLLLPISFFMHIACYIQKQNGK